MAGRHTAVIVVAGTPALRRQVRGALRQQGIDYIDVHGTTFDLAALADVEASIAVVELHMPGMDAAEVLGRLRRAWPDVVIVGISECSDFWSSSSRQEWGLKEVLPTPLEDHELLRAIS